MTQRLHSTPLEDGFWMPAEFGPHSGTWMLWPERPDNWRLGAKPAQAAYTDVAAAIAQFEPVTIGVNEQQYRNARNMLPPQVRVLEISSNDAWMRDCGPTFVVHAELEPRGINWKFNAWGGLQGGLYFPWHLDDEVPIKVLETEGFDRYDAPLVLEGGSIHTDGEGTLYTTEECLLNRNRNPGLSQHEIESLLRSYLGISKVIWIAQGIDNDETDGHVDNILSPAAPGVVALAWTGDTSDPQHRISTDAYERLIKTTDARGRRIEVHKIPLPDPMFITTEESQGVDAVAGTFPRKAGDRMAASYVNFYVCNGGVVVPTFNDRHDAGALERIGRLFPERRVVGVPAREILLGGGNIHCITQQQPASPSAPTPKPRTIDHARPGRALTE